ncbi:MAG: hypothetical protein ACT4NY_19140 [Pseudonocardiales bacterium]
MNLRQVRFITPSAMGPVSEGLPTQFMITWLPPGFRSAWKILAGYLTTRGDYVAAVLIGCFYREVSRYFAESAPICGISGNGSGAELCH